MSKRNLSTLDLQTHRPELQHGYRYLLPWQKTPDVNNNMVQYEDWAIKQQSIYGFDNLMKRKSQKKSIKDNKVMSPYVEIDERKNNYAQAKRQILSSSSTDRGRNNATLPAI